MLDFYPESYLGGGDCISRIDMRNTEANRNAVYIVRIVRFHDRYSVLTHWGAHGSRLSMKSCRDIPITHSNKDHSAEIAVAHKAALDAAVKKNNRGYVQIWTGDPRQQSPTKKKAVSPHLKRLPYHNLSVPLFSEYTHLHILPAMYEKTYVFESVGREHVFIMLEKGMWHVFSLQLEFIENILFSSYIPSQDMELDKTILIGYQVRPKVYAIFDFVDGDMCNPPIKNVADRPWKERRAMLTYIFSDLYKSADPYDTSLNMHLNEYVQSKGDKTRLLARQTKEDSYTLLRHIDSTYTSPVSRIKVLGR